MELIYPMFTMVVLTIIVGAMTAYARISSAYAGKIDPRYFKLMKSNYEIPDKVAQLGRNFDNLLEVPVLFYAAAVSALALKFSSPALLTFAWAFVVFRLIHTVIHLTYNYPLHRFIPFVLSSACALAMWVTIVMQTLV